MVTQHFETLPFDGILLLICDGPNKDGCGFICSLVLFFYFSLHMCLLYVGNMQVKKKKGIRSSAIAYR